MADRCDQCTYFVEDDEYGDYCSLSLDEDEMEKFLTGNTEQCHYFRLYDESKSCRNKIKSSLSQKYNVNIKFTLIKDL